jgi:hypothetical protein
LALAAYKDNYGCLPPAVTYDADGRAMHSWRVYILPYIERQDIYDQYRFDEPWTVPTIWPWRNRRHRSTSVQPRAQQV